MVIGSRLYVDSVGSLGSKTVRSVRGRSLPLAVARGAAIGVLGGMIGRGGAQFRLPLLDQESGYPSDGSDAISTAPRESCLGKVLILLAST